MRGHYDARKFKFWLSRRRGNYTAQIMTKALEQYVHETNGMDEDEAREWVKTLRKERGKAETGTLPSDGSKGQARACAAAYRTACDWILESEDTDEIKDRIRRWLREQSPLQFIGAELVDMAMEASPNRKEKLDIKKKLLDVGLLEWFDDKFGWTVSDANNAMQATIQDE
jgi:hypothetical protein